MEIAWDQPNKSAEVKDDTRARKPPVFEEINIVKSRYEKRPEDDDVDKRPQLQFPIGIKMLDSITVASDIFLSSARSGSKDIRAVCQRLL